MKPGFLSEVFVSFQGEGAHVGRRHLFVRLAGCNMRCTYCDTPDSLERTVGFTVYHSGRQSEQRRNPICAGDLIELIAPMIEREAPLDAIAVTGGEPLMQSEFLAAFLAGGRFHLPVLLETNGVLPHRLADVLSFVDIVSMDIKLPSNTNEGPYWDAHTQFLQAASTKDLYAKILVDQSTADEEVEQAAALLASMRPPVSAFIQPIVDAAGNPLIDGERLMQLYLIARCRLQSVRALPQTHKLLGIR